MVTVAKSLDVPIKLLIPRASGLHDDPNRQALAMLGLGDVVLPGIMIALALRFDLYMWYLKKQTRRPSLKATVSDNDDDAVIERPLVTFKATYRSATGRWGERFWTRSPPSPSPGSFPKPYFYASIVGYIFGLNTTFGVLAFSGHAQPALLYLVPGVLIAIWGLAAIKGDVKEMWEYVDSTNDDGDKRTTLNASPDSSSSLSPPKADFTVRQQQQQQQQQHQPTKKMNSTITTTNTSSDEVFSITLTNRSSQHSHSPFEESSHCDPPQAIAQEIRSALDSDLNLLRSTSTSINPRHPSLSRLPRSAYPSSPSPSPTTPSSSSPSSTTATDHVHAHTHKRPRVG